MFQSCKQYLTEQAATEVFEWLVSLLQGCKQCFAGHVPAEVFGRLAGGRLVRGGATENQRQQNSDQARGWRLRRRGPECGQLCVARALRQGYPVPGIHFRFQHLSVSVWYF